MVPLWGLFVDVVHRVFSSVDFYSAFGVHRVFGAFFCCGGPLCLRWWGGPDFVFHGVCVAFFFYKKNPSLVIVSLGNMNGIFFCGGPDFGFCFVFL